MVVVKYGGLSKPNFVEIRVRIYGVRNQEDTYWSTKMPLNYIRGLSGKRNTRQMVNVLYAACSPFFTLPLSIIISYHLHHAIHHFVQLCQ